MGWLMLAVFIGYILYGTKYFLYYIGFIVLTVIIGIISGDANSSKPPKGGTIWNKRIKWDNWKVRAIDTDKIDSMTGVEFEQWCARLLKYLGATNIQFTKGSGDQGVDIIADWRGKRYAIQCKRYGKPLGNKPIQEVYAGMQYYHCTAGAVMTNQTFTDGGKSLARSTGVEMWNRPWLESAADSTSIKIDETVTEIVEPDIERKPNPYIYKENGEKEMENGKWPHQHAREIDVEYFRPLKNKPHPGFNVTGRPRFPMVNPYTLNVDSIITVETEPFRWREDAKLFAEYAEGHFSAKVRIEEDKGEYIVVIQTHVRSIQANYREETETFDL